MKQAGIWAVIVVSVWSAGARADGAAATANQELEAKRLFQEGTKAYNLAEYGEAIRDYRAAYKLATRPSLLYNIAQSYRLASDFKNALIFYKNYLNASPDAANRPEVDSRMREMQDELDKQAMTASQPPDGVLPPSEPSIPSPERAAAGSAAGSEAATPPGPRIPEPGSPARPIYKKWWFWTGIGAVAVGATVAAVALSGGGSASAPGTALGNHKVFGAL